MRVVSRRPGPASASAARVGVDQAARQRTRYDMRTVRHQRDRSVVVLGSHGERRRAAQSDQFSRASYRDRRRLRRWCQHPRAPNEQVRPSRPGSRPLATRHRMPTDVAAQIHATRHQVGEGRHLHTGDVGHGLGQVGVEHGGRRCAHARRRHGENGQLRGLGQGISRSGAQRGSQPRGGAVAVQKVHGHAGVPQCQRDRRPDQPGADDQDPLQCGVCGHFGRSVRRAAAPRRYAW